MKIGMIVCVYKLPVQFRPRFRLETRLPLVTCAQMLPFTVRPSYAMLAWRLKAHITASFRVWNPRQLGKITAICPRTFPANVESGENFSVSTFSTEHAGPNFSWLLQLPTTPHTETHWTLCVACLDCWDVVGLWCCWSIDSWTVRRKSGFERADTIHCDDGTNSLSVWLLHFD